MALPQSFLDELIYRSDIVDVISRYVSLQKKGNSHWGLCPFHNEKTPSFSVSQDKQFFHCFGCGEGGNVISFVMKEENLPFMDAVRKLADMAGMTVPEEDGDSDQRRRARERLLALNKEAAVFYHEYLMSPKGEAGLEYLLKRGLSRKTIVDFGIGLAPAAWDGLTSHMLRRNYTKRELEGAFLGRTGKNGGMYDIFRDRVMFPIIDISGHVIAFGGRLMSGDGPKYVNSSDTPVFSKSRNLFALNFAKKSKQGRLILCEGYMDVIALHQAGFDCAVASLGTALTGEQAKLMAKFTKEAVICYDSDGAGQKAAQKAIDLLNNAGLEVKVLNIPDAKDPDEYIKNKGAGAFGLLLDKPQSDSEYRLSVIKDKYVLDINEQRIEYLKEAAKYISSLPSPVEREILAFDAAREANVTPQAMLGEINRELGQRARKDKKQTEREALNPMRAVQPKDRELKYKNPKSALCEERLLALVIEDPQILTEAAKKISPDEFSSDFLAKMYRKTLDTYAQSGSVSAASLMTGLEGGEAALLSEILSSGVSSGDREKELEDYIKRIKNEKALENIQGDEQLLSLLKSRRERKG